MFYVLSIILCSVLFGYLYYDLTKVPPIPELTSEWWGHGDQAKEDTSIKPFKINISEEVIQDLQERLRNARKFTPPLEGIQQQYGMNTNLLKEITDFWLTKYNWREREVYLNKYPQYIVSIQGLNIHYIHIKPTNTGGHKILPLLILHGWPGSVREFYDLIPLLTTPHEGRDYIFELIIPSLPGFGFSDPAVRPGLGVAQISVVFKNFMNRLGFDKYYIQGGDWGAMIVQTMASMFPESMLGVHSNMCIVNNMWSNLKLLVFSMYPSLIVDKKHEHQLYPLSKKLNFYMLETGYFHIQATKPDTVGVGLNDSPAGLAAYILEKFITGTNPDWRNLTDGGLKSRFTYTDLLDNVMIYWVTGSITTSMRLYSESFNKAHLSLGFSRIPVIVPSACARFQHEIAYFPDSLLKDRFVNLVHTSDYDDGGHFAAFENPSLLANDIFTAVDKFTSYDNQKLN